MRSLCGACAARARTEADLKKAATLCWRQDPSLQHYGTSADFSCRRMPVRMCRPAAPSTCTFYADGPRIQHVNITGSHTSYGVEAVHRRLIYDLCFGGTPECRALHHRLSRSIDMRCSRALIARRLCHGRIFDERPLRKDVPHRHRASTQVPDLCQVVVDATVLERYQTHQSIALTCQGRQPGTP